RSLFVVLVPRFQFPVVLVSSVYLLLTRHTGVGGGFAGGIVGGLAFLVRYMAGGRYELYTTAWVQPGALIGTGLTLATGTGLAGALIGDNILSGANGYLDLGIQGDTHLHDYLVFVLYIYRQTIG